MSAPKAFTNPLKWFDSYANLEGKPAWKIILRGAAIPGIIAAGFGFVGIFMGAVKAAMVGALFTTFIALPEIILSILIDNKFNRIGLWLVFGYISIWATILIVIFKVS